MIVLDTNVVSEAMRPKPDPGVLGWLNAQAAAHGFAVATRNTQHFEDAGIALINPWSLTP